jgi:hypothetical protein
MVALTVILCFILIIASTWWSGLWSNLITLINMIIAGLIASSFFECLATKFESWLPSYKNLFEFLAIWILFLGSFIVLRAATDMLSSIRLKFDYWTETVGRSLLSIWIACVFIAFTLFSFHVAPLPPNVMSDPDSANFLIGPDRMWAAFLQSRSRGALSESKDSKTFGRYDSPVHPDDTELNTRVFDPYGRFIHNHTKRREALSKRKTLRIKSSS